MPKASGRKEESPRRPAQAAPKVQGKEVRKVGLRYLLPEGGSESDEHQGQGETGFVSREAFDHKPAGGFLASGEPDRPHWSPPSYAGVRWRDDGMFDLLPAFYHLPPRPKRQPHPDDARQSQRIFWQGWMRLPPVWT
jgi:hypothetical protein